MAFNYIVTAQKSTAVTCAATGNFTGPDDLNVLLGRSTRFELLQVGVEGLKSLMEVPIYGRISIMQFFRPPGESKDLLFLLTAKYQAAILEYVPSSDGIGPGEIVTRAHGSVQDRIGRPAETGIIAVIDPQNQMIGLRIYEGLFKVILWQKDSRELKAFNLRFEDNDIIDIQFLHGYEKPTIAYICQDQNGRHLKTQSISVADKDFVPGPWKQDNVEAEAAILLPIPLPYGGCVVIGQESVSYHRSDGDYIASAPPILNQGTIMCTGRVDRDGSRFLLGDMSGRLYMLLLDCEEAMDGTGTVKDLKVEQLGECSIPEQILYLDNGVVFIGSRLGDSQLIRLSSDPISPDYPNNFVEILDTYTNLGPIMDMMVVDLERQGQGQLITCSGSFKEGSLRIIRNGIGINELATIDLPGIKGLFSVRYEAPGANLTEKEQNLLVVSFVGQTKTLLMSGEEVEEMEMDGYDGTEQTLWTGNLEPSQSIVQITGKGVRLIAPKGGLVSEWKAAGGQTISLASCNAVSGQIVLSAGKELYYLEASDAGISLVKTLTLDFEVACLDITPLGNNSKSEICAIGLWTEISVRLLSLPDFTALVTEPLGGEIIPRSILMANFDGQYYLLAALGDGTLFYYHMDKTTGSLLERKKVTLGTQPTILKAFVSRGSVNVFACSDRPTVIYASNQKLVFSNVNLKLVSHMCSLNTSAYRDSLAMADDQSLMIGTVDEIQKLHIRTVPLGETPRRIAHQDESQTFGVITFRNELVTAEGETIRRPSASVLAPATSSSSAAGRTSAGKAGGDSSDPEETEVHSFLILDQNTFEVIHAHQLGPNEHALAAVSCVLGEDPQPYYIVGTALVYPDEPEAKHGRLLVFHYAGEGKLQLIHEKEVKGAPYSLAVLNGKLLAAINSSVRLFEWTPEKELRLECSFFHFILALYLKTKGDFVLAGDLMRSMCVLAYKSLESALEEIARDTRPNWMTGLEIIDDDTFLGAENSFNLFTVQKDSAATTDEERQRLQQMGMYHIGEMVNVFRHGSLVMQQVSGESGPPISAPILYGTVEGSIGMITQLPEDYFNFLSDLETRMVKKIKSIGKIEHDAWRSFSTDRLTEPPAGFIDGDLIEQFLDLPREVMTEIAKGLEMPAEEAAEMKQPATVDALVKVVEELSRIH